MCPRHRQALRRIATTPTPVDVCGTDLEPACRHANHATKTLTLSFTTPAHEKALVGLCHGAQQRTGSRPERLHVEGPAPHRALTQALRRPQPSPQERSLPVGDVDADVLHQSRGEKSRVAPARCARAREVGAATVVQASGATDAIDRCLTAGPGTTAAESRRAPGQGAHQHHVRLTAADLPFDPDALDRL